MIQVILTLLAIFFAAEAFSQDHDHHPPAVVGATVTGKDTIPDFAGTPTIWTVKSGAWQDPTTWNLGRVPVLADVCNIEEEHVVSFSGFGECGDLGIRGALIVDPSANSVLRTVNTLVYRPGRLHAGTVNQPVTGNVAFTVAHRALNNTTDPLQFASGLIVFGELRMHGEAKTAWVALAEEAKRGDITLKLKSAPSGWRSGDKLLLPDTRQWSIVRKASSAPTVPVALQIEEVEIMSVNGDTVTLTSPLLFDHLGGRDSTGALVSMGHVGNLTRNIIVRSELPNSVRGHTMFTERAFVDVRFAEFRNLGRTTEAPPVTGSNQPGRYPVHFHHHMGPRNTSDVGYQGVFQGNVLQDCRKWCFVAHNSHWEYVADNIAYGATGWGFGTEQGNERGVVFERNLAVKIGTPIQNLWKPIYGGVRKAGVDFGFDGSGFWFAGNDLIVRNNVAANVAFTGFNYNGRSCAGSSHCLPLVPKFRGADIAIESEWTNHKKPQKPQPSIIEASNNETYASAEGAWISFNGPVGLFQNFLGWHLSQAGIYTARLAQVDFRDIRLINNPAVSALQQAQANIGLDIGTASYTSGKMTWTNVLVEGFNLGMESPANREPLSSTLYPGMDARIMEFVDVTLRNYLNVFEISVRQYGAGQLPAAPKVTNFRNAVFAAYGSKPHSTATLPDARPLPATPMDFLIWSGPNSSGNFATSESRLVSYSHQRSGADVEFFGPDQAPDYVMPERLAQGVRLAQLNCPAVGKTNAECMAQYRVATMGRVATCTATHPTTNGFFCPVP